MWAAMGVKLPTIRFMTNVSLRVRRARFTKAGKGQRDRLVALWLERTNGMAGLQRPTEEAEVAAPGIMEAVRDPKSTRTLEAAVAVGLRGRSPQR